jgi:hypothetical protein
MDGLHVAILSIVIASVYVVELTSSMPYAPHKAALVGLAIYIAVHSFSFKETSLPATKILIAIGVKHHPFAFNTACVCIIVLGLKLIEIA